MNSDKKTYKMSAGRQITTSEAPTPVKDWLEEGKRLFGPDPLDWRFVCPICGRVYTAREHKEAGSDGPNKATWSASADTWRQEVLTQERATRTAVTGVPMGFLARLARAVWLRRKTAALSMFSNLRRQAMNDQRIYYTRADERETLVVILTRNGYTVRAGKEPKANGKTGRLFVEYWEESV